MVSPIEIKLLEAYDLAHMKKLLQVFEVAFEHPHLMMANDQKLTELLNNDSFKAIVALQNHEVIGGLTLFLLDSYYSGKRMAYLYDLAVLPQFQRQGIGRALVGFGQTYCKQNQIEEMFVQAEMEDEHAIAFYRNLQPNSELGCIQFAYPIGNK